MRKLLVIGIGTGNPEHMTVQAINALNRADIVLVPRKGADKEDLAELRRDICRRYLSNPDTRLVEFDLPVRDEREPSYTKRVADWHDEIAATYRDLIREHTDAGGSVAFLVWGDPSLYDSTLRILDRLRDIAGFPFEREVIPGITSVQALTASHCIALNTVGNAVHLTTGRKLKEGFPENADSAVVMLDGDMAFRTLDQDKFSIFWGAYLGSRDEITISGTLSEVGGRIVETREEARRRKGWIMDTYLLRRKA
ncbi:precorrin-6A synthase (deacetylating) [Chelativorans salis]|uniref:Precorrin-6A synthase [deacetylating] n=1 Tax=Chelativorans salis TaxID=2978478 RepID=A0ABT2LT65_9HYPH|nr:precorrin-6A synthase (deacetylating) [Chelativorans sp. EGI FJ00035]MCT7377679.1 precorrin-6A synthase (deacetylating) [Chelativorans sp. EGI FJ00035]